MPESNVELTAKFTCEIKGGTIKIQTILNDQCKPFIERIVDTEEKMVRDSLVMMGWTPPTEKDQPLPFTGVVPPIQMPSDGDKKVKTVSCLKKIVKGLENGSILEPDFSWKQNMNEPRLKKDGSIESQSGRGSLVLSYFSHYKSDANGNEKAMGVALDREGGILTAEFNTEDAIMKERDSARASGLVLLKQLNAWRDWAKKMLEKKGFKTQSLHHSFFDWEYMTYIASFIDDSGRWNRIPIALPKDHTKENAEQKLRRIWFNKEESFGNFLNALKELGESK